MAIGTVLCLTCLSGAEERFVIKAGAGYFQPSERSFKDIYGGAIAFGGEISVRVYKSVDVWLMGRYYSRKGSLPITRDTTEMRLIPLSFGPRIKFQTGQVSPYAGVGPVFYFYRETNPIGKAEKTGTGVLAQAGCCVKILKGLLVDVCFDYSVCNVKPQNIRADIGGLFLGVNLGYAF